MYYVGLSMVHWYSDANLVNPTIFSQIVNFVKNHFQKILKQVEDESARRMEHSLPGSIID